MNAFLVGVIAGFGIAIPVGAIAVLIVQVGIKCGFLCAASAGAGAATADLLYAVLAVTGGAALAATIGSIGSPLRWVSAAVLVVIAVRGIWRARRIPPPVEGALPSRGEYAATYAKFLGRSSATSSSWPWQRLSFCADAACAVTAHNPIRCCPDSG